MFKLVKYILLADNTFVQAKTQVLYSKYINMLYCSLYLSSINYLIEIWVNTYPTFIVVSQKRTKRLLYGADRLYTIPPFY